jgi:hypothetical protein
VHFVAQIKHNIFFSVRKQENNGKAKWKHPGCPTLHAISIFSNAKANSRIRGSILKVVASFQSLHYPTSSHQAQSRLSSRITDTPSLFGPSWIGSKNSISKFFAYPPAVKFGAIRGENSAQTKTNFLHRPPSCPTPARLGFHGVGILVLSQLVFVYFQKKKLLRFP